MRVIIGTAALLLSFSVFFWGLIMAIVGNNTAFVLVFAIAAAAGLIFCGISALFAAGRLNIKTAAGWIGLCSGIALFGYSLFVHAESLRGAGPVYAYALPFPAFAMILGGVFYLTDRAQLISKLKTPAAAVWIYGILAGGGLSQFIFYPLNSIDYVLGLPGLKLIILTAALIVLTIIPLLWFLVFNKKTVRRR